MSATYFQGSNNVLQLYLNNINGDVGVGTSNPQQLLDVNGNLNVASNVYANYVGTVNVFLGGASINPLPLSQTGSNILCMYTSSTLSNTFISLVSTGQPYTNVGINFQPDYSRPNGVGAKILSTNDSNYAANLTFWTASNSATAVERMRITGSNGYIGINNSNPNYQLDVVGAINATTYCNLLINSFSNSSTVNAPTNLALSNLYSQVVSLSNYDITNSNNLYNSTVFSSNTAVYASNRIISQSFWSNNSSTIFTLSNVGIGLNSVTENLCVYSNMSLSNQNGKIIMYTSNNYLGIGISTPIVPLQVNGNFLATNYSKIIKSLDTSNSIIFTLNWTNSYNTNNSYYITVLSTQMINSQTNYGYKEQTNLFAVSNYSLIDVTNSRCFGNNANTIYLAMTASNNKSITMTSSTTLVTTGTISHVLSCELIAYPQTTNIGLVWLS